LIQGHQRIHPKPSAPGSCGDQRQTVGSRIPLLGMYSGVEIARVKGQVMPLDWTGVLCIFTRE